MKALRDFAIAYKLVWVRVAFYFLTPAIALFLTQTETYSQDTWDNLGGFLRWRLALACFIAGGTALCAYIDSSLARANQESDRLKERRDTETTFTKIKLGEQPPNKP